MHIKRNYTTSARVHKICIIYCGRNVHLHNNIIFCIPILKRRYTVIVNCITCTSDDIGFRNLQTSRIYGRRYCIINNYYIYFILLYYIILCVRYIISKTLIKNCQFELLRIICRSSQSLFIFEPDENNK